MGWKRNRCIQKGHGLVLNILKFTGDTKEIVSNCSNKSGGYSASVVPKQPPTIYTCLFSSKTLFIDPNLNFIYFLHVMKYYPLKFFFQSLKMEKPFLALGHAKTGEDLSIPWSIKYKITEEVDGTGIFKEGVIVGISLKFKRKVQILTSRLSSSVTM